MARVKVDPGFIPPGGSRDVSTNWFLRNGVWVISNGTVPLQPRTEAQLLERAGFASGSREYAYNLSAADKTAWAASSLPGETGQQTMIGQQSCQWETGNVVRPFPQPGPIPECVNQSTPTYIPSTGVLAWDVVFPDAEATSEAWIMAAIRLSPGMAEFTTPMKLIWRGAATDGVKTLTNELSAVFGSAAVDAAGVDLELRYGNPTDGW